MMWNTFCGLRQLKPIIVIVYIIMFDKGACAPTCARTDGRTLFELIIQIYAVDRQPLFCTFCARAQNVSKQSCHLGPSGPNGKIREKIYLRVAIKTQKQATERKLTELTLIATPG